MVKVLFVCLGNICRSPMAEFVMKELVRQAPLAPEIEIGSRATGGWEHGNPIHEGTQEVLRTRAISFDQTKTSQRISSADFEYFDKIFAMDEKNLTDLRRLAPTGTAQKIQKLLVEDVPDPWHTGDFEETYRLVRSGCQRLMEEIV